MSDAVKSRIHGAECTVWDLQFDFPALTHDFSEDIAEYFRSVRGVYEVAKRCLAQLAGVVLLRQTKTIVRDDGTVLALKPADQLAEAAEQMASVRPPAVALGHHALLSSLVKMLRDVCARIDHSDLLLNPGTQEMDDAIELLFLIQRRLLRAANPQAGLSPVDFDAACCSCKQSNASRLRR